MTQASFDRPRRRPRTKSNRPTIVQKIEADPHRAQDLASARLALSVANALHAALEARGLDQSQLATLLGISESAVSQTMSSDGNLRIATIGRYARALGYQASLRLDSTETGAPDLHLHLPANVAFRHSDIEHIAVVTTSSGETWATETALTDVTPTRLAFKTVMTPMSVTESRSTSGDIDMVVPS
jgi:transcriptional regulator with XRE-family HTH domain